MTAEQQSTGSDRYWLLLGTVSLGTVSLGSVLAPLNSTMLAVALPEIRDDFSLSHAEIGWLVSAYLIAMAVAQPIAGRLSDRLGRMRVLRVSLLAFLALSLAAGAAPNFALLVAFRTGQALMGAAIIPTGMAMIRDSVPVRRLGQSNGITGSLLSLSAAAGPLVGALFLELGSWRYLFLANVPIVALAFLAQSRLRYPTGGEALGSVRGLLDWFGAALLVAALIFLTLLLNSVRGSDALGLILGAVGLGLTGAAFVARQRRTTQPLAGWHLFRIRSYRAATSRILLTNLVMYTTLLSIPFFIREIQDKGVGTTGILLGAMSVLMALLAPLSGRISDSQGRRLPALAGSIFAFAAIVIIATGLEATSSTLFLAIALGLVGIGVGLGTGAAQTAAMESAPREVGGTAAGTNSMMRYLGSILGIGILAGILNTGGAAPDVEVFRAIFIVIAVIAALAIVAASQIHRFPPETVLEVRPSGSPERLGPAGEVPE